MTGQLEPLDGDVLCVVAGLLQGTAPLAQEGGTGSDAIRCAVLLTRQALEQALDALWRAKAPRLADVSRHAQLICLPEYLPDRLLAHRVRHTWSALSRACHHHAYELAPTVGEVQRWATCVGELHAALAQGTRPGG